MSITAPDPTSRAAYRAGALAFVIAAGAILMALGFEYLGGYLPCPLCLQQRYAFYVGVPLLFGALVLTSAEQRSLAGLIFLFVVFAFLANAGLGVYHAGAEWGFWPGPESCAGSQGITTSADTLLESLQNTHVIRCDQAAVRILGISLAGWNVVVSLMVSAASLRAASESYRSR